MIEFFLSKQNEIGRHSQILSDTRRPIHGFFKKGIGTLKMFNLMSCIPFLIRSSSRRNRIVGKSRINIGNSSSVVVVVVTVKSRKKNVKKYLQPQQISCLHHWGSWRFPKVQEKVEPPTTYCFFSPYISPWNWLPLQPFCVSY